MMSQTYAFTPDLGTLLAEIPPDSIISRTYFEKGDLKAILFGFAPGQELSEHTSAKPAILHFLAGEARLTLGEDQKTVQPGAWVYMEPKLPHSIFAESQVLMLLYLL